ncbi:MAG: LysM peptidoglycan-binding domain-containing protein [Rhodopirellula sp.]|nr:LysM peptidoglycan-binding domain-containing protein [Rhodopirellula sp.]
MNSLKNLFIIAVLAAVAYGVYVSLNQNNQSTPPPGVADGWGGPIDVQLPGTTMAPPFDPTANLQTGLVGPPRGGDRGAAPPFVAESPGDTAAQVTPPYSPDSPYGTSPMPKPPAAGPNASGTVAGVSPGELPTGTGMPASEGIGQAPPQAGAASQPAAPDEVRGEFTAFIETARAKLDQGKLEEVHRVLTSWYNDPRLTEAESAQLTVLLDQIAGTVIYSRGPNEFAESYVVKPGDTLQTIADSCDVPWQLLAKINGIEDPQGLQEGQLLKTVPGPFDAVIDLNRLELTLMVQGHYAGRFPIGLGQDREDLEGTYEVRDKVVNPTYYGRDGVIDANDPRNPLGERWIKLDDKVGIHGTNDAENVGRTQPHGSICLGDRDIDDVFDILSTRSRVVIRR